MGRHKVIVYAGIKVVLHKHDDFLKQRRNMKARAVREEYASLRRSSTTGPTAGIQD